MDFYEHLKTYLKDEEISSLKESFSNIDTHAALLNINKMSDEEFITLFPHVKKHPLVEHAYYYDKNEYPLGKSIYHELGCFYLQEPSAMIVSSLLDIGEDDFILDMCAAPGGKTIQAAFKLNNMGIIIANDLSKERDYELVNNLERLGIGNVVVTNNDLTLLANKYKNTFDKIILDAPCSGSGMFRKDNKFIDDWSINKVYKFAEIQKSLILAAYTMLKPGGIISYSTCSYSYEEDEEVVEYLINNTDAEEYKIKDSIYLYKGKYGVHLLSSTFDGEGQYIAQIKKPGQLVKTKFKISNKENKLVTKDYSYWNINRYGDNLFALPYDINLKGFNVIRYGLKVGEVIKDFIKFDLHYARHIKSGMNEINISYEELIKYLYGETVNDTTHKKGYILIKYNNKNVDIAKSDGNIIKNHYPKGLRRKYS